MGFSKFCYSARVGSVEKTYISLCSPNFQSEERGIAIFFPLGLVLQTSTSANSRTACASRPASIPKVPSSAPAHPATSWVWMAAPATVSTRPGLVVKTGNSKTDRWVTLLAPGTRSNSSVLDYLLSSSLKILTKTERFPFITGLDVV